MKSKNLFIFVVISYISLFLITGCSSSSNSIRYNEKEKPSSEKDNSVRFTSDDDTLSTKLISGINIDSLSESELDSIDPNDMPEDANNIYTKTVVDRFTSKINKDENQSSVTLKDKLMMEIIKYLDTPYQFGGTTDNGIDCSAFTQIVYRDVFSIDLLRTARQQYTQGEKISDKEDLSFGDLVFFNTRRRVRPGHVGIYIGDNLFAHASSKHGVIVSTMYDNYYSQRFMGGRRFDTQINADTSFR